MSIDEWINIVKDVGFPILIVMYFMFRLNKSFCQLEKTVRDLIQEVNEKKSEG